MSETMEMPCRRGARITAITDEIIFYKNVGGQAVIEIGKRLIEAKAQLKHGEWLPWLSEKVEFSETSAQRFMQLAREYGNTSLVGDLGTSKALVLLALPASERENFASEKHLVNGEEKSVVEMSKRELEEAVRQQKIAEAERNEARRALEAQRKETEEANAKVQAAQDAADAARARGGKRAGNGAGRAGARGGAGTGIESAAREARGRGGADRGRERGTDRGGGGGSEEGRGSGEGGGARQEGPRS